MAEDNWWASAPLATADGAATKPSTGGRSGVGKGVQTLEAKQIADARQAAMSATETKAIYKNVDGALRRFRTSPGKASSFNAMTPDAPGFLGGIKNIGSSILRGTLGYTYNDSDFDDYAYLKSQQSERVAERQMAQKGVQTESDAARYALADIGPDKPAAVNRRIVRDGNVKLTIAERRPRMMSKWIAKYGSLGSTSPNGWTYDDYEAYWRKGFRESVENQRQGPAAPRRTAPQTKPAAPSGWSGFQEVK